MRSARLNIKIVLALLSVAAGVGAGVLTYRDLARVTAICRTLYRVDVQASQLASDLEETIERRRRDYLYALTATDDRSRAARLEQMRAGDQQADRILEALRRAAASAIPPAALDELAAAWQADRRAREAEAPRILRGETANALAPERAGEQDHFQRAVNALDVFKRLLRRHAREQAGMLNEAMTRGSLKLGLFVTVMGGLIWGLFRSARRNETVLRDLRQVNESLLEGRRKEQSRADALRAMGQQSPLEETLGALAALAVATSRGAGASIWVAEDGLLRLGAKAGPPIAASSPGQEGEAEGSEAGRTAMLRDAAGSTIGMLRVLPPAGGRFPDAAFDELTQLASMAIQTRRLYDRLAFQAQHDLLTTLPNRALFEERLAETLRAAKWKGDKAAVLWIDLDRFKEINDTLGHAAGDELLCKVALRMRDAVRESDTVARVGGDEFAAALGGIRSMVDAEKVAAKIQLALSLPLQLVGHEARASACCGISVYPDHGLDAATLLRNADLAMYAAKRAGRNASAMFRPEFADSFERRQQIERDLPRAMELDELRLEYQPLVDRCGQVRAVEALLRWRHPALGEVSPGEMVPIAEECGAIIRLGEWVLRRACEEGLRFLDSGCVMAVNVSRRQLARADFGPMVRHILTTTGFPPERLELEVTETALMQHLDTVLAQVESLRKIGVRFAMDDFGAGYSSLSLLGRLPVDSIKIDRSFVEMLDRETGYGALLGGLISVAHDLRMHVVAEGVETEQQLRLLQDMDCDLSQGYLLHRPMLPEAVLHTLQRQANCAEHPAA